MAKKDNRSWPDWLRGVIGSDAEELRIWRERFPHLARHISEEARANVQGRDPVYPPTTATL
jgi:hypothetical protein